MDQRACSDLLEPILRILGRKPFTVPEEERRYVELSSPLQQKWSFQVTATVAMPPEKINLTAPCEIVARAIFMGSADTCDLDTLESGNYRLISGSSLLT